VNVLQDSAITDIRHTLAKELSGRVTKHVPILLEDAEIGDITGLAIAYVSQYHVRRSRGKE
jgi:hypothetical protein